MQRILSEKLPDRRIAKTRTALAGALFALMQKHEWEHVTIQLLCDEANVARSSFYAHYDSLGGLLDDVITTSMPAFTGSATERYGTATLAWLVEHISENKKVFFHTVNSPSGAAVLSRFKQGITAALHDELVSQCRPASATQLSFLVGGTFEALRLWAATWRMERLTKLKQDIVDMSEAVLLNTQHSSTAEA